MLRIVHPWVIYKQLTYLDNFSLTVRKRERFLNNTLNLPIVNIVENTGMYDIFMFNNL